MPGAPNSVLAPSSDADPDDPLPKLHGQTIPFPSHLSSPACCACALLHPLEVMTQEKAVSGVPS